MYMYIVICKKTREMEGKPRDGVNTPPNPAPVVSQPTIIMLCSTGFLFERARVYKIFPRPPLVSSLLSLPPLSSLIILIVIHYHVSCRFYSDPSHYC